MITAPVSLPILLSTDYSYPCAISRWCVAAMTFRSPTKAHDAGFTVRHAFDGMFSWVFGHEDPVHNDNVTDDSKAA